MRKTIRRLALFLAAAAVVQGLAMLFLTPAGLEKIFVIPLRLAGEKFKPDTNTYAVYYEIRREVSDADLIVVGADFAVAESYDVLGHFTRFVKQNNNISDVLLPLTKNQVAVVGSMMKQKDEEKFRKRIDSLLDQGGLSEDCCDYFGEIFYVNTTMSDAKKVSVGSYLNEEADTAAGQIAAACRAAERTVFCAVDNAVFDGGFREELDSAMRGKTVLYIRMYYTEDCASPETHEPIVFPFAGGSCYFILSRRMEWFFRYYRLVTGLTGGERADPVDTRFTDCFFVISGGTPTGGAQSASEAASAAAEP